MSSDMLSLSTSTTFHPWSRRFFEDWGFTVFLPETEHNDQKKAAIKNNEKILNILLNLFMCHHFLIYYFSINYLVDKITIFHYSRVMCHHTNSDTFIR